MCCDVRVKSVSTTNGLEVISLDYLVYVLHLALYNIHQLRTLCLMTKQLSSASLFTQIHTNISNEHTVTHSKLYICFIYFFGYIRNVLHSHSHTQKNVRTNCVHATM